MEKLNIGLLFGGRSGEHKVSITSAKAIALALTQADNKIKYNIIPVYITEAGNWVGGEKAQQVIDSGIPYTLEESTSKWLFPPECEQIEMWFPVLHGPNGEDGTVQGLLTLMEVRFVGSGVLGSALGMDKIAMKNAFAQVGLPQVDYIAVSREEVYSSPCIFPKLCDHIDETLGYPCFVKPANLGSSVGITKAKNRSELESALDFAASYDSRIIVEAGVKNAREIECAVLGNDNPQTSVVGEITFNADFYDYETKYTDGKSNLIIPADLPQNIVEQIQAMSIKAFQALGCKGLSRVDFFYVADNQEIFINEINTLPGFTSLSMYPQLWNASGIPFPELVDKLIQLSINPQ